MRVYYKTEGGQFTSEDYAQPINNLADAFLIKMLECTKYKVMWSLRSLEKEINDSEGVIIIECKNIRSKVKVLAEGFNNDLVEKISALAEGWRL